MPGAGEEGEVERRAVRVGVGEVAHDEPGRALGRERAADRGRDRARGGRRSRSRCARSRASRPGTQVHQRVAQVGALEAAALPGPPGAPGRGRRRRRDAGSRTVERAAARHGLPLALPADDHQAAVARCAQPQVAAEERARDAPRPREGERDARLLLVGDADHVGQPGRLGERAHDLGARLEVGRDPGLVAAPLGRGANPHGHLA